MIATLSRKSTIYIGRKVQCEQIYQSVEDSGSFLFLNSGRYCKTIIFLVLRLAKDRIHEEDTPLKGRNLMELSNNKVPW